MIPKMNHSYKIKTKTGAIVIARCLENKPEIGYNRKHSIYRFKVIHIIKSSPSVLFSDIGSNYAWGSWRIIKEIKTNDELLAVVI